MSRRHLRGHPHGPGHAAAAAGTRVSTPKREVSALRLAACHARLQAATLETRVPGTGHSFPSTSRQGSPAPRPAWFPERLWHGHGRQGAGPGLHVTGMCGARSLFFIHVGWKNVFMRQVTVALCHGPSLGLFSPQQMS